MTASYAPRRKAAARPIRFPLLAVWLWPHRAFAGVRDNPRAWLRLGLVAAMASAPAVVFVSRVDNTVLAERVLKDRGALAKVPAEERDDIVDRTAKAMKVALPATAGGRRLAFIFLVAALAFALMRGPVPDLRFSLVLGAIVVGSAPMLIADGIKLAQAGSAHALFVDLDNPVRSNLAAWLALDVKTPLGALAKAVDLFRLWTVALCALGIAQVTGKRGWLTAAAPWTVYAGSVTLDLVGAAIRSG